MSETIRIGKVSSINYPKGTARVTYPDKDKEVTAELPFVAWEYWMPEVNAQVVVAHLSNGTATAVILGPVWNNNHRPEVSGEGVFRKEMSNTPGKAGITHRDSSGEMLVQADHLTFTAGADGVTLTLKRIHDWLQDLEDRCSGHGI